MEAVPFLYRALAPSVIRLFVGRYYDCHRVLFHDPRDDHMRQAESLINGVAKTYMDTLPGDVRTIYLKLKNDQWRDVFRIVRDFAFAKHGDRHLRVGCEHCGDRVDLEATEVLRIYRQFESHGIIRLIQPGCKRQKDERGRANVYQWLLD